MLTLLTNANIFTPDHFGIGSVLLGGGKILYVGHDTPAVDPRLLDEQRDLEGAALVPGFIDGHVHVTGGGGEDGFSTQAPPVPLSRYTRHGVTTVVGLLGTDDETRSTASLVARTRALREEGLSAWCWTGGYHVPPTTLTRSVRSDIVNIDCVIGLGELAISDHRSSQPAFEELARIAADVHVAGLISRKAGVLHLHLGDGPRGLAPVRRLLEETELPARMFHPTHINRRRALFEEACALSRGGVTIDITAMPVEQDEDAWSAADAWERFMESGCPPDQLTMSSDGGGCLPVFDETGQVVSMDFASSAALAETIAELAFRGHGLELILPCVTRNVATTLKLPGKGGIAAGASADIICLDGNFAVRDVMARGQWMTRDAQPVVTGRFEKHTARNAGPERAE
jgi:beta-aspartyl-dipeptidase (metallo-type)